uniref:Uncharacterized protein n=1 Tax=Cacopsylla melanoneura TaxID=428564 RepID=A0A8D8XFD6_9HEMI
MLYYFFLFSPSYPFPSSSPLPSSITLPQYLLYPSPPLPSPLPSSISLPQYLRQQALKLAGDSLKLAEENPIPCIVSRVEIPAMEKFYLFLMAKDFFVDIF